MQIWCSLFRYTGKLFFGCALFVAHSNIIRASWETTTERLRCRKMHSRICVRNITFLTARPPFYFNFLLLSLSTLSPVKIYNIAMAGILHDDTMSERLKIDNFLQFNTSWLASLRKWYYFRLCFSFSCFGYDLQWI